MRIDEKIEKFLNEQSSETVELLDDDVTREKVSKAWPHGITFNGRQIFEPYLNIADKLSKTLVQKYPGEVQEVYLGYIPSSETFICGFDYWPDQEEEEDPDRPGYRLDPKMRGIIVPLHMDGNKMSTFGVPKVIGMDSFYGRKSGAYNLIKSKYPDIIDLRLD